LQIGTPENDEDEYFITKKYISSSVQMEFDALIDEAAKEERDAEWEAARQLLRQYLQVYP
jgi:hypothetical protein